MVRLTFAVCQMKGGEVTEDRDSALEEVALHLMVASMHAQQAEEQDLMSESEADIPHLAFGRIMDAWGATNPDAPFDFLRKYSSPDDE
jgi:hypothetical protein